MPSSGSIEEIADTATTTPESWTDFLAAMCGWTIPPVGVRSADWSNVCAWIRLGALAAAGAAIVALVAGCGNSEPARRAAPRSVFAYDASRPLRFEDHGRVNARYRIAVRDVSYATPSGRVRAYLVVPPLRGPLPGVVYVHGSGGDRRQLLVPATWLAARGAVALVLTAPSAAARPQAVSALAELRRQRRLAIADVVAVGRAFDVLRSLPSVDRSRIGFVGWSAGARTGAVVAGVDPRVRALVLMSAGASPVAAYVAQAPASLRPEVARTLHEIDPLRYIARARSKTLLLQDGRADEIVPRAALTAVARAAPAGTSIRWYDAGHALNARAYRDQLAWLARRLAIHGRPVAGVRTGP